MGRITKQPDVRRSELLACAQRLFYTQGYENTSVDDIVSAVGVAKGTFYYYFSSKLTILEATVDQFVSESMGLMHAIIADRSLAAIPKWTQAIQATNRWKAEHRTELLAIVGALEREENALLKFKMQSRMVQHVAEAFALIIAQGVEEGVFSTDFPEEAAEITLSISIVMSNALIDPLLNPQAYKDPFALARRKLAAAQTAIERVLGAPKGSLELIDAQSLAAWFQPQTETVA